MPGLPSSRWSVASEKAWLVIEPFQKCKFRKGHKMSSFVWLHNFCTQSLFSLYDSDDQEKCIFEDIWDATPAPPLMSFDTNRRPTAQSNGQSQFWFLGAAWWKKICSRVWDSNYEHKNLHNHIVVILNDDADDLFVYRAIQIYLIINMNVIRVIHVATSSSDLFVSLDIQLYLTYDMAQSHWCPIRVSSMALLVMLNMIRIQKHNQLANRKRYS